MRALPRPLRALVATVLALSGALLTTTALSGCPAEARPCLEREECFAGEFCDRGTCRPYNGTTTTGTRPGGDMAPTYPDVDQGGLFDPDRDMGADLDEWPEPEPFDMDESFDLDEADMADQGD